MRRPSLNLRTFGFRCKTSCVRGVSSDPWQITYHFTLLNTFRTVLGRAAPVFPWTYIGRRRTGRTEEEEGGGGGAGMRCEDGGRATKTLRAAALLLLTPPRHLLANTCITQSISSWRRKERRFGGGGRVGWKGGWGDSGGIFD